MNHNGRTVDKFIFPSTSWFSGGVWLAFGETVIGVPKVPALSCIYLLLFSFHSISRKKMGHSVVTCLLLSVICIPPLSFSQGTLLGNKCEHMSSILSYQMNAQVHFSSKGF